MRKATLLLTIVVFFAQTVLAKPGVQNAPAVEIQQQSINGVQFSVEFPEITLDEKSVDGTIFTQVTMEGTDRQSVEGAPDLPVWTRVIAIPSGATLDVNIVNQQMQMQPVDHPVIPYRPVMDNPELQTKIKPLDAIYQDKSTYPVNAVQVSEPMIMRDLTLVAVSVNPVAFHPATGELEVTQQLTLNIKFNGGTAPSPDRKVSEAFFPIYKNYVMNWQDFVSEDNVERGTLMIVTHPSLEDYLNPLVRWKMQQGFEVHLVNTTTTGSSTSSIKSYIQSYYTSNPSLEYVLLVGDEDGSYSVPTYIYNSDVGDRQYGELVGSDYLPEVAVGRYSVGSTLDLSVLISKQVRYEKEPYNLASGWLTRALNVASYAHAYSILEIMRNVTHLLQEKQYTQIDSAYYPATGDAAAHSIIENAINTGVGFVNYRGWAGSSGWYEPDYHTSDLNGDGIHNGFYNGIMTSIVCGTGNFGTGECFGEAWIRRGGTGTPTNPKGGVAFYGSSEFNQNVRYANIIDASFYYGAIRKQIRGFGSAVLFSKMAVWEGFPNNRTDGSNSGVEFYFHIYNILGDPSLQMWVGNPRSVVADFPTTISTVAPTIPVHVVTTLFGADVKNAHVTLLPEDNEDIFLNTVTDRYGRAYLDVEGVAPGDYVLTISGKDMIPVSQTVTISEQPVALSLDSWGISDGSGGNGDNLWQPGETLEIAPELTNVGNLDSDTVTAELQVLHPDMSVTTAIAHYMPVEASGSATPLYPFEITVDEDVLDFGPAGLLLTITTRDTGETEHTFLYNNELQRGMPGFELSSVTHNAEEGVWQPGEIIDLELNVKNAGPVTAESVIGWITSSHENVTFPVNAGSWGTMNMYDTAINSDGSVQIKASANTIPGTVANFVLHVGPENGAIQQIPFNLSVGEVESTDPVGPDNHGYLIFDNTDTDYSKAPVYDWVEIAPSQGGPGETIPLNDTGENNDDVYDIELPFTFKFYGVYYNTLTINSNGYLGMGHSRWFSQRNWPIPGPLGAEGGMIAGYWDDLYLRSGSEVATYYDDENGRFIIEYSQMGNVIGSTGDIETFQIILYDESVYPTPTGDGEIAVQYKTVNEVPGYGERDNASTVGIMNEAHSVGIQYVYAEHYPPGGALLGTGRAIKFTTDPGTATGPPDLEPLPYDSLMVIIRDTASTMLSVPLTNIGGEPLSYSVNLSYDSTSGWCTIDPLSGSIPPGGSVDLQLAIDTTNFTRGAMYGATVQITSNSINYSNYEIPVNVYFNTALAPGDVNADGVVNAADVALIEDHIMHDTPMAQLHFMLADSDGDGRLTVKDILPVLQQMDIE